MAKERGSEDAQTEGQLLQCRRADPVTVVLDHEDDRQLVLNRLDHGFVELALPRGRIADRAQYNAALTFMLDAPRRAYGRKALRRGRRGGWINAKSAVGAVDRHLAPA